VERPLAKTVIAALDATEFSTVADAEAAAGFHIPVPSDSYPMAFGKTYLQIAQDQSGIMSTTQYTYTPLAPHSIGVDAGPASNFNVDGFAKAPTRTLGTRSGHLLRNDPTAIQFAFEYGMAVDGQSLWCVVQAPAEIGLDGFEEFVGTLK
jgi:hypothetical protein